MQQEPQGRERLGSRFSTSIREALPAAGRTAVMILSVMIPVSLAVTIFKWTGALDSAASLLDPAFSLLGLPGSSALVFLTGLLLNIYSAIAVIGTLSLSLREVTILALMCLIAHNLFVETAILKRTGSSALGMVLLRLGSAFVGGFSLNLLLPQEMGAARALSIASDAELSLAQLLAHWTMDTLFLVTKIILILAALMILQRLLDRFGVTRLLARLFAPLMRLFGLPSSASFFWIVANTLGLAYGAAVLMDASANGTLPGKEADQLNHHIAISHSLLEDTLLFAALGVPAGWILFPRLILAGAAVWGKQLLAAGLRRT